MACRRAVIRQRPAITAQPAPHRRGRHVEHHRDRGSARPRWPWPATPFRSLPPHPPGALHARRQQHLRPPAPPTATPARQQQPRSANDPFPRRAPRPERVPAADRWAAQPSRAQVVLDCRAVQPYRHHRVHSDAPRRPFRVGQPCGRAVACFRASSPWRRTRPAARPRPTKPSNHQQDQPTVTRSSSGSPAVNTPSGPRPHQGWVAGGLLPGQSNAGRLTVGR